MRSEEHAWNSDRSYICQNAEVVEIWPQKFVMVFRVIEFHKLRRLLLKDIEESLPTNTSAAIVITQTVRDLESLKHTEA